MKYVIEFTHYGIGMLCLTDAGEQQIDWVPEKDWATLERHGIGERCGMVSYVNTKVKKWLVQYRFITRDVIDNFKVYGESIAKFFWFFFFCVTWVKLSHLKSPKITLNRLNSRVFVLPIFRYGDLRPQRRPSLFISIFSFYITCESS